MLDVLSLEEPPGMAASKTRVVVPPALRPLLAERAGLSESAVATLESLPLPFAVSGLDARGRELVQNGLERAGISAIVTPTSSSSRQQGPISIRPMPGGNFAGLLALGDVSVGAVGTTTYVCGDRALAFGHSLRLLGATTLSANDAEAITITTDPTARPVKLSNLGSTVGVLDQDRTVAIAAKLGERPPLIRIRSIVKAPDLGRSRIGVSWTPSSELLPDVVAFHLLSNLQAVFDEDGDGRARIEWRVKGRRASGEDWFLRRANRYASRFDIAFGSIGEVFNQLAAIEVNSVEDVTFRRVKHKAKDGAILSRPITSNVFTVTQNGFAGATGEDAVDGKPGRRSYVVSVFGGGGGGGLRSDRLARRRPPT
jgi:hypothetical protein